MSAYDYLTGTHGSLSGHVSTWAIAAPDKAFAESTEDAATSTSYQALDVEANRIGAALLKLGVKAGDRVGVYMSNRPEYPALMLGIHRAGAVFVPCSTHLAADELRYQLDHVGASVMFADAETVVNVSSVRDACPAIEHVVVFGDQGGPTDGLTWHDFVDAATTLAIDEMPLIDADDLAMVMYTSGTTARPKGIMYSHGNMVAAGTRKARALDWSHGDRFLHFFPMYHANGLISSLAPAVLVGATLVFSPRFSVRRFSADLSRHRITMCNVNGAHLKMILATPEGPEDAEHAARRMYLGLAPDEPVIQEFERRFNTTLFMGYGLSECLVAVATPAVGRLKVGSAGRPSRGLSLRITDEHGADVPTNGVGEIRIRGDQRHEVTLGYYLDAPKTAEAYGDGWLHTGDLGRLDPDGFLWYEGRIKDVIKRSGFTVGAAEVERVIATVPGVEECAVVGTPDRMREEAIVAFIVASGDHAVVRPAALEACRVALADYKVPQHFEFLPELPRDTLGKINRTGLRDLALQFRVDTTAWTPLGGPASD